MPSTNSQDKDYLAINQEWDFFQKDGEYRVKDGEYRVSQHRHRAQTLVVIFWILSSDQTERLGVIGSYFGQWLSENSIRWR